jgi:hypothetical protein
VAKRVGRTHRTASLARGNLRVTRAMRRQENQPKELHQRRDQMHENRNFPLNAPHRRFRISNSSLVTSHLSLSYGKAQRQRRIHQQQTEPKPIERRPLVDRFRPEHDNDPSEPRQRHRHLRRHSQSSARLHLPRLSRNARRGSIQEASCANPNSTRPIFESLSPKIRRIFRTPAATFRRCP